MWRARALRERLAQSASEWERLGHSGDALWSARQFVEVSSLSEMLLPARSIEFLAAARERVARGRRRRRAALALAPVALMGLWSAVELKSRRNLGIVVNTHLTAANAQLGMARKLPAGARGLPPSGLRRLRRAEGGRGRTRVGSLGNGRRAERRGLRTRRPRAGGRLQRGSLPGRGSRPVWRPAPGASAQRRFGRRDGAARGAAGPLGALRRRWPPRGPLPAAGLADARDLAVGHAGRAEPLRCDDLRYRLTRGTGRQPSVAAGPAPWLVHAHAHRARPGRGPGAIRRHAWRGGAPQHRLAFRCGGARRVRLCAAGRVSPRYLAARPRSGGAS